jgi:transcriptional regulator with XRE-family HTH domain
MTLAQRLRDLRRTWALTQQQVAASLKVPASLISMWESGARIPSPDQLDRYAQLFAGPRPARGETPAAAPLDELGEAERQRRAALQQELQKLRVTSRRPTTVQPAPAPSALDGLGTFWRTDAEYVQIICGRLPRESRPPFASGRDRNYIQLAAYADQDALIELFGHLRAANPAAQVEFELASRLESDDVTKGDVVLLGGQAYDQVAPGLRERIRLPLERVPGIVDEGEVFRHDGTTYEPAFSAGGEVVEDVGLIVRMRSPFNPRHTLTLLSGVFTRGVYGAVRSLTDRRFLLRNEEFLRDRFTGSTGFGLLVRVTVIDHATVTPDLTVEANRLCEFEMPG